MKYFVAVRKVSYVLVWSYLQAMFTVIITVIIQKDGTHIQRSLLSLVFFVYPLEFM